MRYVIVQRTEDGTGYYTGGRDGGWTFEASEAKRYTTSSSANRKARAINSADKEFGAHIGAATVRVA